MRSFRCCAAKVGSITRTSPQLVLPSARIMPPLAMGAIRLCAVANALGAVDLVGETLHGRDFRSPVYESNFEQSVIRAFESALKLKGLDATWSIAAETYGYMRELRNSVVHRGLASATAGHAAGSVVVALCPPTVTGKSGAKIHRRPCTYMLEFTELCDLALNSVIYQELETRNGFDLSQTADKDEVWESVQSSEAMPDWAKAMARQAFAELDWRRLQAELFAARTSQLRRLLGRD
jgi:hypothetical protein